MIQIDHNARTWQLNVNWGNSVRAHWMTLEIEQWSAVAYLTHTHYSHFPTTLKSAKCQNICFAEDFSSSRDPRLTSVHEVVVPWDLRCFDKQKMNKVSKRGFFLNIKEDIEEAIFLGFFVSFLIVIYVFIYFYFIEYILIFFHLWRKGDVVFCLFAFKLFVFTFYALILFQK